MKIDRFRINKNISLNIDIDIKEMSQDNWIIHLKDSFINQKFVKICGKDLMIKGYEVSQENLFIASKLPIKYEFTFDDGSIMIFRNSNVYL